MTIAKANSEELIKIKQLYLDAFPKSERKPFDLMLKKSAEGRMEMLTVKDNDNFLGLAITIIHEGKALLDYFAISPDARCGGVGSKALKELINRYRTKKFILEIELPDDKTDNNEERIRRKKFYLKNGMTETNIHVSLFGIDMELLTYECKITFEEYLAIYKETFNKNVSEKIIFLKMLDKE